MARTDFFFKSFLESARKFYLMCQNKDKRKVLPLIIDLFPINDQGRHIPLFLPYSKIMKKPPTYRQQATLPIG